MVGDGHAMGVTAQILEYDRIRAFSVLPSRTTVSRHWRSRERNPSSVSGLLANNSRK
jgi:hypothetical protein